MAMQLDKISLKHIKVTLGEKKYAKKLHRRQKRRKSLKIILNIIAMQMDGLDNKMKEQLISLKTDLLSKERGCNLEICTCGGYPECICDNVGRTRITQSLLQKWIEENHDLYIDVETELDENQDVIRFFTIVTIRKNKRKEKHAYGEDIDSLYDSFKDTQKGLKQHYTKL